MKLHQVQVGIQPCYNTCAAPPDNNLELGSRRVAMECSGSVGGRVVSLCLGECEGLVGSRGGERCSPALLSPARAPGLLLAKLASLEPLAWSMQLPLSGVDLPWACGLKCLI